jgi:hypothetical protein
MQLRSRRPVAGRLRNAAAVRGVRPPGPPLARNLLWRRPAMNDTPALDTRPWWLHEEQSCDYCLQRHAVGLELRCRECDEIVCGDCAVVVVETRVTVCPACAPRHARRR